MGRRFRLLLQGLFVAVLATAVIAPSTAVGAAPFLMMSFTPDTIALNGTSTLSFVVVNPEPTPDMHNVTFTDTLPAGLSAVNGSTSVCPDNGGNLTITGGTHLVFTRSLLPETWQCPFSVTVTGTALGVHTNTTGAVTSSDRGTGNSATADLTVVAATVPPTIAIAFGASTIFQGDTTSLTFTIANPNPSTTLTGIDVMDWLPGGLAVAYPNGLTGSCGGGTITAAASSSTVHLAGAALPAGTDCSFSVDVVGAAGGYWTNTTNPITSSETDPGLAASADLNVTIASQVGMSFSPAAVSPNGTSTLHVALLNPETNVNQLNAVSFIDILPDGLTVADGSSQICPDAAETTDWATLTTSGGNTIRITGLYLPVSWVCSFSVTVTAPAAPGDYVNTSGPMLDSDFQVISGPGTATLNVLAPPTLSMAFASPSIVLGAHAPLTFTVTNAPPNGADLQGVALTATLPAGLSATNGSQNACGGTVLTSSGNTIAISGAVAPVGSACVFSVDVTGSVLGAHTAGGGPVTTSNAGTGNSATASITVVATPPDPTPVPTPVPSPSPTPSATPPSTSTGRGGAQGPADPPLPLLLFLALVASLVVVRRAARSEYSGRK